jgi:hypothetical protein
MELRTQLWIQFFKKYEFHLCKSNPVSVDFCATHTKISGLPVANNGSSQLFKEKNVIQIQSWFLKFFKIGYESNYNHGIWTSLLEPELECFVPNCQSG